MDRTAIDTFLAERRNAILATVSAAGDPVQVPLWFLWENGRVYISVATQRGFFPHLRRRPRVAVAIDDHGVPIRSVLIRGDCRVIEGDAIWPITERIVARYVPEAKRAERLARLRKEPRVILEITPTMITSWSPTPMDREVWRAEPI